MLKNKEARPKDLHSLRRAMMRQNMSDGSPSLQLFGIYIPRYHSNCRISDGISSNGKTLPLIQTFTSRMQTYMLCIYAAMTDGFY